MESGVTPLASDDRQIVIEASIDRADHSLTGHPRAIILDAGHLANRMNAGVCPSGQHDSCLPAIEPGECPLQLFLNASPVSLSLRSPKAGSVVRERELQGAGHRNSCVQERRTGRVARATQPRPN